MNELQRSKNLSVPEGRVDVVLDTDAYNEIDDQFAIAYLLSSKEKLTTKAIYAAPFHNAKSRDAEDGMEHSYDEILKVLDLMEETCEVYRGSRSFLTDEKTPVLSPAAEDLVRRASAYSPENPLYVVAIGAITNVASALLLDPSIAEKLVIVWLGGHGYHFRNTKEFNMKQDVAAARVVMQSGAPFVQLPCKGVVSEFRISGPELDYWFKGKNKIATYLAENTLRVISDERKKRNWTRVIWDVTAVAWLLNDSDRFMLSRVTETRSPKYDYTYETESTGHPMRYVYFIKRDELMNDLIERITGVKFE